MRARNIEGLKLREVYFGDRDILRLDIDFRIGEARITFSGAAVPVCHGQVGASGCEEMVKPVLVLAGLRSVVTSPATARPETIVLRSEFAPIQGGYSAEFLVVGDPEPVTMRFECERLCLET
jgi:hypothetical protein